LTVAKQKLSKMDDIVQQKQDFELKYQTEKNAKEETKQQVRYERQRKKHTMLGVENNLSKVQV
jgi:hypothetical protein